jgi:hypothetical protein
MGTWGASIFANDLAADLRGDWREMLEDGTTPEAATDHLLREYASALADPDDGPVFWLALAAVQQSTGRLLDRVRDEALSIIDRGGDVATFAISSPAFGRQRARALSVLSAKLRGPQKAPTPIKRPRPHPSPAEVGDVVRIRGAKGDRDGLFLVVRIAAGWPRGSLAPELVGLRWPGGRVPVSEALTKLPIVNVPLDSGEPRWAVWMVQGPMRGPNAFPSFAEIVARGVQRGDVAPLVQLLDQGRPTGAVRYSLTSWRAMSLIVSGEFGKLLDDTPKVSWLNRLGLH